MRLPCFGVGLYAVIAHKMQFSVSKLLIIIGITKNRTEFKLF